MLLERLHTFNFRNLKERSISFEPGLTFIAGRNGQGKSNLLEAIYTLGSLKSFRTSKLKDCISWGQERFSLFGKVRDDIGSFEVSFELSPRSRKLLLNGDKVKGPNNFVGRLLTVHFSPSDMELVRGSPGARRRFLDKHSVDLEPKFFETLTSFSKALESKQALLKEGASNGEIEAWNLILAQKSIEIWKHRKRLIYAMSEILTSQNLRIGREDGDIELQLIPGGIEASRIIDSEATLLEILQENLVRERITKRCLIGPHRDELEIRLGGVDARSFASQGQARSLVLALKLSVAALIELERGTKPLILLDDVDSELDVQRRSELLEILRGDDRQIFITGTDTSSFAASGIHFSKVFELDSGLING